MTRPGKLKVYRTAIGFHDAYVAAPSQKAALAAWGSDKDLFARGVAEIVTDQNLTAEPLASPGRVVKRLRGTAAEQMAALPPDRPTQRRKVETRVSRLSDPAGKTKPKPKPKVLPPPSRAALTKAETALEEMQRRERDEIADLDRREAELARERKQSLAALAEESERLTRQRNDAASHYDRAIALWRNP